MSKLTEKFREKGIFNPYNFYGDQPYITYQSAQPRSCMCAQWSVVKRGLDMGEAWYDYGCKTFTGFGLTGEGSIRTRALLQAQAWASEKFGIKTWMRDPFGSYGEVEYVKKRIKELS
jgi:hypothetical protein